MKPVLQALVLADRVYEDKATGKKIVAGIFHQLYFIPSKVWEEQKERLGGQVPVLPGGYQAGSPFAYLSLTDIKTGEQPFIARYVNLRDESVLFQFEFKITVDNPLQIVDLVLPLPTLPTNAAGVFAFEVLWKDEPLGSYRIIVEEAKIGDDQ